MAQNINRLTINAIFEKNKQGNYTKDALLRQDILRYYVKNTVPENIPFKLRNLQRWIVNNNSEIGERYVGSDSHTSYPNRIHANASRIEGKFSDLVQLQLIRRSSATKLQQTDSLYTERVLYEYTRGGIFLALIIESINLKKVISITRAKDKTTEYRSNIDNIHQNLYDCLVNSVFKVKENSVASNIFYSNLLKKCKDKGVFDKFVDHVHHIINNTHDGITSVLNLFGRVVSFAFFNNEKSETAFTNILIETIEELDQEDKKLILNRLKMLAEEDYENSQQDLTREYEEFRFELRYDYERIAIQGHCESCKIKQNVALKYLDLKFLQVDI
jgi:hypothetical protein